MFWLLPDKSGWVAASHEVFNCMNAVAYATAFTRVLDTAGVLTYTLRLLRTLRPVRPASFSAVRSSPRALKKAHLVFRGVCDMSCKKKRRGDKNLAIFLSI